VKHTGGRYVLNLSTSDYGAVKTALDDADNLIASYKRSHTPLKIDIIADHTGIDVLRMDVSPYRARIEKLLKDNRNVISLFACAQSLSKAKDKEGHSLIMLPGTHVDKRANELIPKRLDEGWVYIKA
jgi:intracellular sulfur oxidation DsrE/DsrF family protein